MPASHLCIDCGLDLARERAVRDPAYGLPLVTCPRCDALAVRRRHPLAQRWRTARRIALAGTVLTIQLGLLAVCLPLVGAICVNVAHALRVRPFDARTGEDTITAVVLLGVVPVALGTWLTAGFPHWRPWWTSRAAFATLVAFLLAIQPIVVPIATHFRIVGLETPVTAIDPRTLAARLAILALLITISIAGVPMGRAVLATLAGARRRRWSLARRRRRMERPA